MTKVFLSYARADGQMAAARLRAELSRSGFEIWQDTQNMEGGQVWKGQLRQAVREVDAVLVLMTPGAVASKHVELEWEMAQMVGKRVIPLLMLPCDVPAELGRLHYHNLSEEQSYIMNLAGLINDLQRLGAKNAHKPDHPSPTSVPTSGSSVGNQTTGNRNISIGGSANNSQIVIGDGNNVSQSN